MSPLRWPQSIRIVPEQDTEVQRVATVLIGAGDLTPYQVGETWYGGNLDQVFVGAIRLIEEKADELLHHADEIEASNPDLAKQIRETVRFANWALRKPLGQIIGTDFAAA